MFIINQINLEWLKKTFHNRKKYNIVEIGNEHIVIKSRRKHLFLLYMNNGVNVFIMEGNNKVFLRSFNNTIRVREFLNYMYKLGEIL